MKRNKSFIIRVWLFFKKYFTFLLNRALESLINIFRVKKFEQEKWDGPLVSVIIPCYNYGRYITNAVTSVLNQTFQNFELIVIDDGSTDPATKETLINLKPLIERKGKLIFKENEGVSKTRNYGISLSRGKYICCLDADDTLRKNYLKDTLSVLEKDPGIGLAYSYAKFFGDKHSIWITIDLNVKTIAKSNHIPYCAVFPKKVWEEVGGFNENMKDVWEDWDFFMAIAKKGYRGRVIPKILFNYRVHSNSLWRNISSECKKKLYKQIQQNHPELFDKTKINDIIKKQKFYKTLNWKINLE